MKISLNKEKFEKHLINVSKALDSNPHLVALKGLVIEVKDSNIKLIASNGILSVQENIKVNQDFIVHSTGKILVPGKLFVQIIKKIDNEISLSKKNKTLVIKSEGFETSINLLDINDYPEINFDAINQELEISKKIQIDLDIIKDVIKNVAFAADERSDKIYLNGVNFKTKNNFLYVTASNRYRLAQEVIKLNQKIDFDIIILAKNLKDLLPQNAKGTITWNLNEAKILTSYESTNILLKLIDAIYPNVEKNIPLKFDNTLAINVDHLLTLIDKASILNSEYNNTLTFKIVSNELIIESVKNEVGTIRVKTNKINWDGENKTITFNGNFLKDAITKFSHKITINFSKLQKAIVIKGESNPNLIQIILPHRNHE